MNKKAATVKAVATVQNATVNVAMSNKKALIIRHDDKRPNRL
ncbi:MAG: hypothetical protein R3D86_11085 [Emcibacteraceae bacterium]